jgi:hypothetical protein
VKVREEAAPVDNEVAAPFEDAAAVSGDAAEAPLEEANATGLQPRHLGRQGGAWWRGSRRAEVQRKTEEAKSAAADTTQQAGDKASETAKEKASGVTGAAQAKARQAEERGQSLVDELRFLLVHGLLHVLDYDQEAGAELLEVEVVKVAKAKTPSAEADEAGAVADDVDVFVGWDAEMVGADTRVPDEEAVGDLAAVREG